MIRVSNARSSSAATGSRIAWEAASGEEERCGRRAQKVREEHESPDPQELRNARSPSEHERHRAQRVLGEQLIAPEHNEEKTQGIGERSDYARGRVAGFRNEVRLGEE